MIDRRPIENPKLSWRAKGMLAYFLSRPNDWIVRFADLAKRSPDGAHTVRQTIKELKNAGHIKVTAERENGRVKQWTYKVFELPSPDGEFQQVEILQVENRTLNNTDSTNTDSSNTVAKTPKPKANTYPELLLFRNVTKRYPHEANWQDVISDLQKVKTRLGRDVTAEDLLPFFKFWTGKGYNAYGLGWLEWAVEGSTPNNGTWRAKNANYQNDTPNKQDYTENDRRIAEKIKQQRLQAVS